MLYFFPILDEFLEKYESLLSDCAINNEYEKLIDIFGVSFVDFYNSLEKFYFKSMRHHYRTGQFELLNYEELTFLIQEMEKYREDKNKHVRKYTSGFFIN